MQAALQAITIRYRRLVLPVLLTLAGASGPQANSASAADAAMTVEVPVGRFKSLRMRNLPKDAVVAVGIQTNGQLAVSVLNQQDYRKFPKSDEPVFVGSVDRKLSFTLTIPQLGDYFLVFDNRLGGEAQKVKFAIHAERGGTAEQRAPAPSLPAPQLRTEPKGDKL
jgi:hypothetical protein